MTWVDVVSLVVSVGLLGYLMMVLVMPERF